MKLKTTLIFLSWFCSLVSSVKVNLDVVQLSVRGRHSSTSGAPRWQRPLKPTLGTWNVILRWYKTSRPVFKKHEILRRWWFKNSKPLPLPDLLRKLVQKKERNSVAKKLLCGKQFLPPFCGCKLFSQKWAGRWAGGHDSGKASAPGAL